MSHLLEETVIGLSAVAGMIPGRSGARLNPATVFRWATSGTKTSDGRTVKLEHFRAGNRILTTREAVLRYFAALEPQTGEVAIPAPRSPSKRASASARASKQLAAMGA